MEKKIEDLVILKRQEIVNKQRLIRHDIGVANKLEHKFEAYVLHEKLNMLTTFAGELEDILIEIKKVDSTKQL